MLKGDQKLCLQPHYGMSFIIALFIFTYPVFIIIRKEITEEEIDLTGYKPVKHLKEDQHHLRSLLNNPNLSSSSRKYNDDDNMKMVLQEALQFLDMREKFWASQ